MKKNNVKPIVKLNQSGLKQGDSFKKNEGGKTISLY